jgi:tRNA (guanine-N7-)-methyltransferase
MLKNTIRPIRSYVLRQGRLTKYQSAALDKFSKEFIIPFQNKEINFDSIFNLSENKIILEIGFGMGDTTARIAENSKDTNFIGIEVHSPGVGNLLNRINEQEIKNLRIIQHDAVEVLEQMIPKSSLDGVHIFFPDPWHKKKHNKRRLIQSNFIEKIGHKIKKNGYVHISTDWEDYALSILDAFKSNDNFSLKTEEFFVKPDYRPNTKYENRGIRLGHQVWDILFVRQ